MTRKAEAEFLLFQKMLPLKSFLKFQAFHPKTLQTESPINRTFTTVDVCHVIEMSIITKGVVIFPGDLRGVAAILFDELSPSLGQDTGKMLC